MNNIPNSKMPLPQKRQVPEQSKDASKTQTQKSVPQLQRIRARLNSYMTATVILSILLLASVAVNVFFFSVTYGKDLSTPYESSESVTESFESDSDESSSAETDGDKDTADTSHEDTSDVIEADPYEEEILEFQNLLNGFDESQSSASQSANFTALLELLKTENRPIHTHAEKQNGDESGDTSTSDETESDENTEKEPLKTPAKIAFAYLDLTNGRTFSYNGDEVMFTASIIKAPYVYSVLRDVEEFEFKKMNFDKDGNALYDENGNALFEGDHPNLDKDGKIIYLEGEEKFDLSRKWTYDSKTMFEKGTGEIQNKEDGFTLTYLELMEYSLKYSDNVAFKALREAFGYSYYNDLAKELGVVGVGSGFMQLNANDCTKLLRPMYDYLETDSPYAAVMKKAMSEIGYSVMITPGVAPYDCVHKYGWDIDSYHDMGIVYHDRPFALVILTDLDEGKREDYVYMQKISKAILTIHENFS